jgi:transcriptional regulator GlxA family with amidase domain
LDLQHHVAILVADGFTDSSLAITMDVLRTACSTVKRSGQSSPFRITVASADGKPVRSAAGLDVSVTGTFARATRATIVLVPGLWAESTADIEAAMARDDVRRISSEAKKAYRRGAVVGASCSGTFVLAQAGLLDGRHCTTTWWLAPYFRSLWPQALLDSDRALVVDRRVLTAGAVFAQADLVLHLVGRYAGLAVAKQCTKLLLLDRHRSQAAYMAVRQLVTNDRSVRAAEAWIRKNLASPFLLDELSRAVGVGSRTLARRIMAAVGLSPLRFVQRLKIEAAVNLLETTTMSFEEITARVGYSDGNALRRLLQREGLPNPRALRTTK